MQRFDIIDFHVHPFIKKENNLCQHYLDYDMNMADCRKMLESLAVKKICGSVVSRPVTLHKGETYWDLTKARNDEALALKKQLGDFYYPGFHVHPDFVDKSCEEIDKMTAQGLYLIGEICPYLSGFPSERYNTEAFNEIIDYAAKKNCVISIHNSENNDDIDAFVKRHPDTKIVLAHPYEYYTFLRCLERAKYSENYYLDVSGYGLFRQNMLRYAIDKIGVDRILFGSDFPTGSAAMYVGGVVLEPTITDEEKQMILSENAKKLLNLQ